VTGDLKQRKSSGSCEPPPLERREALREIRLYTFKIYEFAVKIRLKTSNFLPL
jgi:hypothetical protein